MDKIALVLLLSCFGHNLYAAETNSEQKKYIYKNDTCYEISIIDEQKSSEIKTNGSSSIKLSATVKTKSKETPVSCDYALEKLEEQIKSKYPDKKQSTQS